MIRSSAPHEGLAVQWPMLRCSRKTIEVPLRLATSCLFVLALAASVAAQEPKAQPGPEQPKQVDCPRQIDNCRACRVLPDGRKVCSNIGIACQPRLIPCPATDAPPSEKSK